MKQYLKYRCSPCFPGDPSNDPPVFVYNFLFTFLIFRDVAKQQLAPDSQEVTLTNLVADLARKAKGQEWVDFFDILLGSLISLLRRIHSIHTVIMDAIDTANSKRYKN